MKTNTTAFMCLIKTSFQTQALLILFCFLLSPSVFAQPFTLDAPIQELKLKLNPQPNFSYHFSSEFVSEAREILARPNSSKKYEDAEKLLERETAYQNYKTRAQILQARIPNSISYLASLEATSKSFFSRFKSASNRSETQSEINKMMEELKDVNSAIVSVNPTYAEEADDNQSFLNEYHKKMLNKAPSSSSSSLSSGSTLSSRSSSRASTIH